MKHQVVLDSGTDPGVVMPSEIELESLEQVARALGERWAKRITAAMARTAPESSIEWPCTLDQARKLLADMLGDRVPSDRQEALALMVERSARAAWNRSTPARRTNAAPNGTLK
jgi:hypothetical protein